MDGCHIEFLSKFSFLKSNQDVIILSDFIRLLDVIDCQNAIGLSNFIVMRSITTMISMIFSLMHRFLKTSFSSCALIRLESRSPWKSLMCQVPPSSRSLRSLRSLSCSYCSSWSSHHGGLLTPTHPPAWFKQAQTAGGQPSYSRAETPETPRWRRGGAGDGGDETPRWRRGHQYHHHLHNHHHHHHHLIIIIRSELPARVEEGLRHPVFPWR